MYVCVCTYVRVCVCMCVRACACMYVRRKGESKKKEREKTAPEHGGTENLGTILVYRGALEAARAL